MNVPPALDHLVYGTRDLPDSVEELEGMLGVRAARGGSHPGRGTYNALASLGEGRYLEIIGPDPSQGDFDGALPFGLDDLDASRLVTWAVRTSDLDARTAAARRAGYDPGDVLPRSRQLPDGTLLEWRLTAKLDPHPEWLVPFLIDWGNSPHPSRSAPSGLTLMRLSATHPDPAAVRRMLAAAGVQLEVVQGASPGLIALIDTPMGVVELR